MSYTDETLTFHAYPGMTLPNAGDQVIKIEHDCQKPITVGGLTEDVLVTIFYDDIPYPRTVVCDCMQTHGNIIKVTYRYWNLAVRMRRR